MWETEKVVSVNFLSTDAKARFATVLIFFFLKTIECYKSLAYLTNPPALSSLLSEI